MQRMKIARYALILLLLVALAWVMAAKEGSVPAMELWHTEELEHEFEREMIDDQVSDFSDYLDLERTLFEELDKRIFAKTPPGSTRRLNRFSRGSLSDFSSAQPNWNRSYTDYVDSAKGGVLLLHGMSDSPYSLRTLAQKLRTEGYDVVSPRLPGHGTIPSALRQVKWQDMAVVVDLAMAHLADRLQGRPINIIGYSTGASLALNYTLDRLQQELSPPASLVLVSPAIRVHPVSALAGFKDSLSALPGLEEFAYVSIMDEFDPYKYNSFATNAAAQVHAVTNHVDRRIKGLAGKPVLDKFPPVLVHKSVVDATVTTEAIVDKLLMRLPAERNELVLFDINSNEAIRSTLLIANPAPLADRLIQERELPFDLTMIVNSDSDSYETEARSRAPFSEQISNTVPLDTSWPHRVISLSHVALSFPPDDPLYGASPSNDSDLIFLGNLAFYGERGLLRIAPDWLLRMRYNPFYPYFEQRTLDWLGVRTSLETSQ